MADFPMVSNIDLHYADALLSFTPGGVTYLQVCDGELYIVGVITPRDGSGLRYRGVRYADPQPIPENMVIVEGET